MSLYHILQDKSYFCYNIRNVPVGTPSCPNTHRKARCARHHNLGDLERAVGWITMLVGSRRRREKRIIQEWGSITCYVEGLSASGKGDETADTHLLNV